MKPTIMFEERNFEEDLRWSELPEQWITYLRAVRHWWPDTTNWERITDLARQRRQRDIGLELTTGVLVRLQVKHRRSDYGDMCIEYRHDHDSGKKRDGWILEASDADFLLYCVPGRVYKMSFPELAASYKRNEAEWLARYDGPGSLNSGHGDPYWTRFVTVPWAILEAAGTTIEIVELPKI